MRATRVLSFSYFLDLFLHTYVSFAYFTRSRLTVWFFVTRLLTNLEGTVSEAWRIAASFCIATVRIRRDFAIQLKRFVWYIGRAVYPVLRAGWLNVCRTHGPTILSSSLIVPTAALNHIYLSENQAASTMEAVHLSRRVSPFDARRVEGWENEESSSVRRIVFRDYTHHVRVHGVACLHEQTERLPTVCPLETRLSRVVIDFSLLLRNSITGRTIGLIWSLITSVDDDWVRWVLPPRLLSAVNVSFWNVNVYFWLVVFYLSLIINFEMIIANRKV